MNKMIIFVFDILNFKIIFLIHLKQDIRVKQKDF